MMINKAMIAWGIVGVSAIASTVSIIFAVKANKRMKATCEKLDVAVDVVAENVEIDVEEEVVEEAVKIAAERYAQKAVRDIKSDIMRDTRKEIAAEVKKSVDMAYANLKSGVKEELDRQVRNIDISGIKKQVIEEASEKAKEKFSTELDSIAARFSSDLESSSKIYKTIADKLGG